LTEPRDAIHGEGRELRQDGRCDASPMPPFDRFTKFVKLCLAVTKGPDRKRGSLERQVKKIGEGAIKVGDLQVAVRGMTLGS
jgi:hypothetical protein